MSDFFVMLVFKTVIYKSKLLDFKDFASLELEHSESNTDFVDGHYLGSICKRYLKSFQDSLNLLI